MSRRVPCVAVAALVALTAIQLSAQKPSVDYKAPRTPWGDPDLQGNYTNLSEAGTPMERPKAFDGRNMNRLRTGAILTVLEPGKVVRPMRHLVPR